MSTQPAVTEWLTRYTPTPHRQRHDLRCLELPTWQRELAQLQVPLSVQLTFLSESITNAPYSQPQQKLRFLDEQVITSREELLESLYKPCPGSARGSLFAALVQLVGHQSARFSVVRLFLYLLSPQQATYLSHNQTTTAKAAASVLLWSIDDALFQQHLLACLYELRLLETGDLDAFLLDAQGATTPRVRDLAAALRAQRRTSSQQVQRTQPIKRTRPSGGGRKENPTPFSDWQTGTLLLSSLTAHVAQSQMTENQVYELHQDLQAGFDQEEYLYIDYFEDEYYAHRDYQEALERLSGESSAEELVSAYHEHARARPLKALIKWMKSSQTCFDEVKQIIAKQWETRSAVPTLLMLMEDLGDAFCLPLIEPLLDEEAHVPQVMRILEVIDTPQSTDWLLALSQGPTEWIADEAFFTLMRRNSQAIIPGVLIRLEPGAATLWQVFEALPMMSLDQRFVEPLHFLALDQSHEHVTDAIKNLCRIEGEEATDAILSLLTELSNPTHTKAIKQALGLRPERRVIDALLRELSLHSEEEVYYQALKQMGPAAIMPFLEALIDGTIHTNPSLAVEIIYETPWPQARPHYQTLLSSTHMELRAASLHSLAATAKSQPQQTYKLLQDHYHRQGDLFAVINAMGRLGTEEALAFVQQQMQSDDLQACRCAIHVTEAYQHRSLMGQLVRQLKHKKALQHQALKALFSLDRQSALTLLTEACIEDEALFAALISDKEEVVRSAGIGVLVTMAPSLLRGEYRTYFEQARSKDLVNFVHALSLEDWDQRTLLFFLALLKLGVAKDVEVQVLRRWQLLLKEPLHLAKLSLLPLEEWRNPLLWLLGDARHHYRQLGGCLISFAPEATYTSLVDTQLGHLSRKQRHMRGILSLIALGQGCGWQTPQLSSLPRWLFPVIGSFLTEFSVTERRAIVDWLVTAKDKASAVAVCASLPRAIKALLPAALLRQFGDGVCLDKDAPDTLVALCKENRLPLPPQHRGSVQRLLSDLKKGPLQPNDLLILREHLEERQVQQALIKWLQHPNRAVKGNAAVVLLGLLGEKEKGTDAWLLRWNIMRSAGGEALFASYVRGALTQTLPHSHLFKAWTWLQRHDDTHESIATFLPLERFCQLVLSGTETQQRALIKTWPGVCTELLSQASELTPMQMQLLRRVLQIHTKLTGRDDQQEWWLWVRKLLHEQNNEHLAALLSLWPDRSQLLMVQSYIEAHNKPQKR